MERDGATLIGWGWDGYGMGMGRRGGHEGGVMVAEGVGCMVVGSLGWGGVGGAYLPLLISLTASPRCGGAH
jgi:hypothetical protein